MNEIIKELFYTVTILLAVLTGLELAWPGLILAYFNLNWLLLFWLFLGILIILKPSKLRR
jgi:hypothetical protein